MNSDITVSVTVTTVASRRNFFWDLCPMQFGNGPDNGKMSLDLSEVEKNGSSFLMVDQAPFIPTPITSVWP